MFLGTYKVKLDEKSRIVIPSKLRPVLESDIVLTRGQEYCLYLYKKDEFKKITERISEIPTSQKKIRDFLRIYLSSANEVGIDKQGRVSVPQFLKDYADLQNQIIIIGMGKRLEVWNEAKWNQYVSEAQEEYSSISDEVIDGIL